MEGKIDALVDSLKSLNQEHVLKYVTKENASSQIVKQVFIYLLL